MRRDIKRIGAYLTRLIPLDRRLVRMIGIALVSIGILYPLGTKFALLVHERISERRVAAFWNTIDADHEYALEQTKATVDSKVLDTYIVAGDRENTLTILDAERRRRGLMTMTAVNRDGTALARSPAFASYGDYVAQTQPWGRAAARGESVVMLGEGRNYPLIIIAAHPILEEETVVGALYGGFWLGEPYARRIYQETFNEQAHILFYSTSTGVLGTSFEDSEVNKQLSAYFNIGSYWVQEGYSGSWVKVNGRVYLLHNVVINDPSDSARVLGGAIIFSPLYVEKYSILVAFLTALIAFFIFRFAFTRTGTPGLRTKIVIALWCLAILLGAFWIVRQYISQQVIPITEHMPLVYNSSLGLRPDSNIIDLNFQQRIAITLDAGGESLNAVRTVLAFDPTRVRVDDIITTDSLCRSEFFLERVIDTEQGEVRIACIVPSPGFPGTNAVVAELLVQPLQTGAFTFLFKEGTQVLANDGLGTNVLRAVTNGSYSVVSALRKISAQGIVVPVFSSTHSNEERWYQTRRFEAFWPRQGEDMFLYTFDRLPETIPTGEPTDATRVTHTLPGEDTFYFHIAAVDERGIRGPTRHMRINVDTTPPHQPTIRTSAQIVRPGDVVRFEFFSADEGSGLQESFYVDAGNSLFLPSGQRIFVPFPSEGEYTVRVRVFDNAGNWSGAETTILVRK